VAAAVVVVVVVVAAAVVVVAVVVVAAADAAVVVVVVVVVGCYIWYSEEGTERAGAPPCPLLAVPNATAHPSTASVLTSYYSMWQYYFMCPLKG